MPLYDYECMRCGKTEESFSSVGMKKNRLRCSCGGHMMSVISTSSKPMIIDEYDEVLGQRVTGPKHRKLLMRKHPLALEEL